MSSLCLRTHCVPSLHIRVSFLNSLACHTLQVPEQPDAERELAVCLALEASGHWVSLRLRGESVLHQGGQVRMVAYDPLGTDEERYSPYARRISQITTSQLLVSGKQSPGIMMPKVCTVEQDHLTLQNGKKTQSSVSRIQQLILLL